MSKLSWKTTKTFHQQFLPLYQFVIWISPALFWMSFAIFLKTLDVKWEWQYFWKNIVVNGIKKEKKSLNCDEYSHFSYTRGNSTAEILRKCKLFMASMVLMGNPPCPTLCSISGWILVIPVWGDTKFSLNYSSSCPVLTLLLNTLWGNV